jgi:O-methyltransferase involved in polyketide biosynthesis
VNSRLFCDPFAAQRVNTFELDRAKMSFAKQAALRKELGSLPKRVQSVSIDFNGCSP